MFPNVHPNLSNSFSYWFRYSQSTCGGIMVPLILFAIALPFSAAAMSLNLTESQARTVCDALAAQNLGVMSWHCDAIKSYDDLINVGEIKPQDCSSLSRTPDGKQERECVRANGSLKELNALIREKRRLFIKGYVDGANANSAVLGTTSGCRPTEQPTSPAEAVPEG